MSLHSSAPARRSWKMGPQLETHASKSCALDGVDDQKTHQIIPAHHPVGYCHHTYIEGEELYAHVASTKPSLDGLENVLHDKPVGGWRFVRHSEITIN